MTRTILLTLVVAASLPAATTHAEPVVSEMGNVLSRWNHTSLDVIIDGTSNTLLFTETTTLGICLDRVGFPGAPTLNPIADGSSNTLLFAESRPFDVNIWRIFTSRSVAEIADGSSNTLLVGEGPQSPSTDAFCLSGVTPRDPDIEDGTSNTILFGEESAVDLCANNVRIGIRDGLSNTIVFGEVVPRTCLTDVRVRAGRVAEPVTLGLLAPGLAVLLRRRVRRLSIRS
jgi:hypothetical protein